MTNLRARGRYCAAVLLAALALALPRLLLPPGFMPASGHDGRFTLVFCDPALRAAFGGHVHSHGHDQAGGESCPFGMSGGPALLPAFAAAVVPIEGANLGAPPRRAGVSKREPGSRLRSARASHDLTLRYVGSFHFLGDAS